MDNRWSYNQYSLYRMLFGLYLTIHFLWLLPWGTELFSHHGMLTSATLSPLIRLFPNILSVNDSSLMVNGLLVFGLANAILFTLGKWDRLAACCLWYTLTCLLGRNPFIANPSLPYVGWLLLAHALIPTKSSQKQWEMPRGIYFAAWVAMALGYSYSGYTKLISPSWLDGSALTHVLESPLARVNWISNTLLRLPSFLHVLTWGALLLELLFAPLALVPRIRPWLWLALLGMHFALMSVIRFVDLSFGMVILHLFTFNPAWIVPKKSSLKVFYDGSCGLCNRFVVFTLTEMSLENPLHFAPLQSEAFKQLSPTIPESIVVYDETNKRLLFKTKAIATILIALGGLWTPLGMLLKIIPSPIANVGYDCIAKIRHKLFSHKACELLKPEWKPFVSFE